MTAISVHEATISTATVEIKTLTISGKQVTLAVFRQLQQAALLAGNGALRGAVWGRVNYFAPSICDGYGRHAHVVWQLGTELRRDCIFDRFTSTHAGELNQLREMQVASEYLEGSACLDIDANIHGTRFTIARHDYGRALLCGMSLRYHHQYCPEHSQFEYTGIDEAERKALGAAVTDYCARLCRHCRVHISSRQSDVPRVSQVLLECWEQHSILAEAETETFAASMARIAASPQLFIAV